MSLENNLDETILGELLIHPNYDDRELAIELCFASGLDSEKIAKLIYNAIANDFYSNYNQELIGDEIKFPCAGLISFYVKNIMVVNLLNLSPPTSFLHT